GRRGTGLDGPETAAGARRPAGGCGRHARLCPAQPLAARRLPLPARAAALRRRRLSDGRPERGKPALGAEFAAAIGGSPLRQRQAGAQPLRGDGRGNAADAADRPLRGAARGGAGRVPGVCGGLLRRTRRQCDQGDRRRRADDPGAADPDHHRHEGAGGVVGQPDGAGGRGAGLAVPGAHDSLAGDHLEAAGVRADRTALGDGRPGGDRPGVAAEPAPVPWGIAGRVGLGGGARLDRAGGARAGTVRGADVGDDALLGELQRRDRERLVVVVGAADRGDRGPLRRPLPGRGRAGRGGQSSRPEPGL
ncbi:MAG: ABC transporter, permease protein 2 (cluster 5, nickel/peptides/opines), partial [uncultured Thermomicrobiales bacterium]